MCAVYFCAFSKNDFNCLLCTAHDKSLCIKGVFKTVELSTKPKSTMIEDAKKLVRYF